MTSMYVQGNAVEDKWEFTKSKINVYSFWRRCTVCNVFLFTRGGGGGGTSLYMYFYETIKDITYMYMYFYGNNMYVHVYVIPTTAYSLQHNQLSLMYAVFSHCTLCICTYSMYVCTCSISQNSAYLAEHPHLHLTQKLLINIISTLK